MLLVFFFFKQKTAYEMRISDWSSDVCSSDLDQPSLPRRGTLVGLIGSAFYGGNLLRPPRAILERADEAALHHVGDSAEHVLTVAPDLLSQVRLGDGLAMLDQGLDDLGLGRGRLVRLACLGCVLVVDRIKVSLRSEEHTSELQSLMRISYAVFCLK